MFFNEDNFEFVTLSPWWPGLTEQLVNDKWALLRESGITKENYSTDFFLEAYESVAENLPDVDAHTSVNVECAQRIEFLTSASENILSMNGLEFYSKDEFRMLGLATVIRSAFEKIRAIPSLYESTELLARNIVLLRPHDDSCDTSYSSPRIPFTIFISIPRGACEYVEYRVAESIVHECMHLQLTLLEERIPLIANGVDLHFSPWKGEWRNSSGILHALYVFSVIAHWMQVFRPDNDNIGYIENRIDQIRSEISQIRKIKESNDLTPVAKTIVQYLLDYLPTDGAIL